MGDYYMRFRGNHYSRGEMDCHPFLGSKNHQYFTTFFVIEPVLAIKCK